MLSFSHKSFIASNRKYVTNWCSHCTYQLEHTFFVYFKGIYCVGPHSSNIITFDKHNLKVHATTIFVIVVIKTMFQTYTIQIFIIQITQCVIFLALKDVKLRNDNFPWLYVILHS
jgi:hypothetical protein